MVPVLAASFVLASLAAGLYERKYIKSPLSTFVAAPVAAAGAWGILLIVNYFITYVPVGRWVVIIGWAELSVAAVLLRILFHVISDRSSTNILLVGDEQGSQLIQAAAENLGDSTIRVAETIPANGCSITSRVMDLRQRVASTKADVVVVEDDCRAELLEQAVECVREGTWVSDFVWYFENTFEKVPVEKINLNWLISAHLHLVSPLGSSNKAGVGHDPWARGADCHHPDMASHSPPRKGHQPRAYFLSTGASGPERKAFCRHQVPHHGGWSGKGQSHLGARA